MDDSVIRFVFAFVGVLPLVAATLVVSARNYRGALMRGSWINVLFPLSQVAILLVLMITAIAIELPVHLMAIMSAFGVFCAVLDTALFRALSAAGEKQLKQRRALMLEQQMAAQEEHYASLVADVEAAKGLQAQLVQDLQGFEALVDARDAEGVARKTHDVAGMLSLKGERFCEHSAVDALLTVKARECDKYGICLKTQLNVPFDLAVPAVDLCAVFANLIDNALAACRVLPPANRSIELNSKIRGGFFMVEVKNPFEVAAAEEGKGKEGEPASTRRRPGSLLSEHGWGLRILSGIAERYDGSFETRREGDAFVTSLAINTASVPADALASSGAFARRAASTPVAFGSAGSSDLVFKEAPHA